MEPSETNVCEHIRPIVDDIHAQGAKIAYAGQAWSSNCHIWVYFENVVLDLPAIRTRLKLPEFVIDHVHRGTHDGAEQGFVCQQHNDAVMGMHPDVSSGARTIV